MAKPLANALWNKGGWIQNRANTLAINALALAIIIKRAVQQKKNPNKQKKHPFCISGPGVFRAKE